MYSKQLGKCLRGFLLASLCCAASGQEPHESLTCDEWVRTPSSSAGGIPHCGPWVRDGYVSVQVNVDKWGCNIVGDAANEPSIAVDANDPRRIAIGWRQFDSLDWFFPEAGYGYTGDAGHSWTFPGTLDPGVVGSDPVLAAGPDSELYFSTINFQETRLFRSDDGGMTWPFHSQIYPTLLDKPWLIVDQTDGIGRGNVYFSGCCDFFRSTDGGRTFDRTTGVGVVPHFAVGIDGTLYVLAVASYVFLSISENASDPMQAPTFTPYKRLPMGEVVDRGPPNGSGLLAQGWVWADHSATDLRGNLYVLTTTYLNNSVGVRSIRSEDGGVTWSEPVRVDDDHESNDEVTKWFAMMSVAPNGRIDAAWNDTRNFDVLNISELYYSYSTDGGRTWAANVPVSQPFNSWVGRPAGQGKIGDYYHMHSDNLGVNIAYATTFNNEQDIYFLRIGPYDCNGNEVADETDIADETSLDCNENGVPDECEYRADYDGDALTTLADYFEFVRCQQKPRPPIQPDPYRSDGAGWARPTLRDLSDAKHGEPADLYAARGDLGCCGLFDIEPDGDIDLSDFSFLQRAFNGP